MNKDKIKQILLIAVSWIFTFAIVYLVYIKAKILFNHK